MLKSVENPAPEGKFANLLDIIEVRSAQAADATWWGPVIGSDEDIPSDNGIEPVADLVSDDKFIPMTVCEVNE